MSYGCIKLENIFGLKVRHWELKVEFVRISWDTITEKLAINWQNFAQSSTFVLIFF